MYNSLQLALSYLRYYATAANGKGHGIHSPFVYDFVRKVLMDKTVYPAYTKVEKLRRQLLTDKTVLNIEDLGAGSSLRSSAKRSVSSIARNAAKPAKYGQLLFRMIRHYQPGCCIEIGSSLGLTSSYLALADPRMKVVTMEGAREVAARAVQNFGALGLSNIELVEGNFDDTLVPLLTRLAPVDFAFIDGNHRMQPTMQYFDAIISRINNSSILVLDDIHWSPGMEKAWEYCKSHPSVTLSIDLFFIGILVFKKEILEKQQFIIRF